MPCQWVAGCKREAFKGELNRSAAHSEMEVNLALDKELEIDVWTVEAEAEAEAEAATETETAGGGRVAIVELRPDSLASDDSLRKRCDQERSCRMRHTGDLKTGKLSTPIPYVCDVEQTSGSWFLSNQKFGPVEAALLAEFVKKDKTHKWAPSQAGGLCNYKRQLGHISSFAMTIP